MVAPFSRLIAKVFPRPLSRSDRRRAVRLGLESLEGRDVPAVSFSIETLSDATEGGDAGQFRVTATGDAFDFTNGVYAYWTAGGGTATLGNDFSTSPGPGYYLVFNSSGTTATVTVTPVDDMAIEGDETVGLTVQRYQMYPMGPQYTGTLTIHDNDFPPPPPTVSVEAIGDAVEGGAAGSFRFTRTGDTSSSLTVTYSVLSGELNYATSGDDFVPLSGTVTIPAGGTYQDALVEAWADNNFDPDETVMISVDLSPNYTRLGAGVAGLPVIDTSFVVTTTDDTVSLADNRVSLREAIMVTNDIPLSRHRKISFNFPGTSGTIKLNSTLPPIEKAVSITGSADRGVTITGPVQHLRVGSGADVELTGLKFLDGVSDACGGAVFSEGDLTITNCEFRGNRALDGGAIGAITPGSSPVIELTISGCDINGNYASRDGGGVFASGVLVSIENTVVGLNKSMLAGGGLAIEGGFAPTPQGAYLSGVQIIGNTAARGGGVYARDIMVTLEGGTNIESNVTVNIQLDGTFADTFGGGLYATHAGIIIGEDGARFASNQATTGRAIYMTDEAWLDGQPLRTGGDQGQGGIVGGIL